MKRNTKFLLIMLLCSVLALCSLFILAFAEHTPATNWTHGYVGDNNVPCCSIGTDCRQGQVRIVSIDGDITTVAIDGEVVTMPSKGVHQSETMMSWYCLKYGTKPTSKAIRCVFWAIGS